MRHIDLILDKFRILSKKAIVVFETIVLVGRCCILSRRASDTKVSSASLAISC